MEWKIYEEWLDITLYRQMTNLIYKLSSNEEKYKIVKTADEEMWEIASREIDIEEDEETI